MRAALEMFECVRKEVGDEVELLHDVHERLQPIEAVGFAKDVEQFKLYFLEDPLAPEDLAWFKNIRQQCATPIAMGELFNHPREWQPLMEGRMIDFLRMHVSQMGGITPARNAAAVANMYGIRTAWHGPGDTSPVGHAANLHLDLWAPNFGVQEWYRPEMARRRKDGPEINQRSYDMFPGLPEVRNGYMYPNDQPGLGIDINEETAAKFPLAESIGRGEPARLPDGTPVRP
jgi:mannonate dehydratase